MFVLNLLGLIITALFGFAIVRMIYLSVKMGINEAEYLEKTYGNNIWEAAKAAAGLATGDKPDATLGK